MNPYSRYALCGWFLAVGDQMEGQSSRYRVSAVITSGFLIRLVVGEECESLSRVAEFKNDA